MRPLLLPLLVLLATAAAPAQSASLRKATPLQPDPSDLDSAAEMAAQEAGAKAEAELNAIRQKAMAMPPEEQVVKSAEATEVADEAREESRLILRALRNKNGTHKNETLDEEESNIKMLNKLYSTLKETDHAAKAQLAYRAAQMQHENMVDMEAKAKEKLKADEDSMLSRLFRRVRAELVPQIEASVEESVLKKVQAAINSRVKQVKAEQMLGQFNAIAPTVDTDTHTVGDSDLLLSGPGGVTQFDVARQDDSPAPGTAYVLATLHFDGARRERFTSERQERLVGVLAKMFDLNKKLVSVVSVDGAILMLLQTGESAAAGVGAGARHQLESPAKSAAQIQQELASTPVEQLSISTGPKSDVVKQVEDLSGNTPSVDVRIRMQVAKSSARRVVQQLKAAVTQGTLARELRAEAGGNWFETVTLPFEPDLRVFAVAGELGRGAKTPPMP